MASCEHIITLRFLIVVFSLAGLACHSAQCVLLTKYEEWARIPNWFQAGHWQYLAWFIALSTSLFSILLLCISATCHKRGQPIKADKTFGAVNIASMAFTVIINTFFNEQEPWTNGIVEYIQPIRGLNFHCTLLDEKHDAAYPLLLQRCVLIDCVYVVAIITGHLWMFLVIYAYFIEWRNKNFAAKPKRRTQLVVSKSNRNSYNYNNDTWKLATMPKQKDNERSSNYQINHDFSNIASRAQSYHTNIPQQQYFQQQQASSYYVDGDMHLLPSLPNLTNKKSFASHQSYPGIEPMSVDKFVGQHHNQYSHCNLYPPF